MTPIHSHVDICPECRNSGLIQHLIPIPHMKGDGTVDMVQKSSTWSYCTCEMGVKAEQKDFPAGEGC